MGTYSEHEQRKLDQESGAELDRRAAKPALRGTPGPWHLSGYAYKRDDAAPTGRRIYIVSPDSDLAEGYTIDGANGQVCQISRHRGSADARLIAAAPELAKALQICRNECHHPGAAKYEQGKDILDVIEEALAKAGVL